jgi:shikimate dehydrogenase
MGTEAIAVNLDGATRLHVIVGDPIAQVKSPAGMTQAFTDSGYNGIVVPVHVSPQSLSDLLKGIRLAQNLDGIIVTVPHKFACYGHCAGASERAHFLGAVQVMRRLPDGGWFGENFDGLGFVDGLRAKGFEPNRARALLVGAGGAGSAIALSLIDAGVREIAIYDENASRRDTLLGRLKEMAKASVIVGSPDPAGFDLVANATPAGMRPDDPFPVKVEHLSPDTFVGCVITKPAVSPWVEAARKIGCRSSVGADMYAAVEALMLEFLLPKERRGGAEGAR